MAGQPVKRMMIAELERRAIEMGTNDDGSPATAYDVVREWMCQPGSLRGLAADIGRHIERSLQAGTLSTWLHGSAEGRYALSQGKIGAAQALVEEAQEILEEVDEDRDAISKAKARADLNTWTASRYDRKAFGADTAAAVQLNINLPTLHLDALRAHNAEQKTALASAVSQIGTPVTEEAADYEIVGDAPSAVVSGAHP